MYEGVRIPQSLVATLLGSGIKIEIDVHIKI